MSADNFYLITPHPTSGFAVLMGFASNEDEVLTASDKDKSYPTLEVALEYATNEYSEYGVQVSQAATDLDKRLQRLFFLSEGGSPYGDCQHTREPEYDRQECRYGDGRKHTKCPDCGYTFDGCEAGYSLALKQERYNAQSKVVELINKHHNENHLTNSSVLSIGSKGVEFNSKCSCQEIKELIVLSLVDEAIEASQPIKIVSLTNQEVADALVGLPEDEAVLIAKEANLVIRITERDGAFFPATRDYVLDRVNLRIKDGRIYKADLG